MADQPIRTDVKDEDAQMKRLREYAEWGGRDSTYRWALDEINRLRKTLARFENEAPRHIRRRIFDGR